MDEMTVESLWDAFSRLLRQSVLRNARIPEAVGSQRGGWRYGSGGGIDWVVISPPVTIVAVVAGQNTSCGCGYRGG